MKVGAVTLLLWLALSDASAQETPLQQTPHVGYDNGFYMRSQDGAHELKIGGLFIVRGRAYSGDAAERVNEVDLPLSRLELSGKLDKRFLFLLEPRFGVSSSSLDEAWVGYELAPDWTLRAGRLKVPYSQDEWQPRRWRDTIQKSLFNSFGVGDDNGVGTYFGSRWTPWQGGVAVVGGSGSSELDDGKELAARVVHRPWLETGGLFEGLHLGASATFVNGEQDLSERELTNEAAVPYATYSADARLDGLRTRAGLEFGWMYARHELHGEWTMARADLETDAQADTANVTGYTVTYSHMLSQHKKSFFGFTKDSPLATEPGFGAWQLVAHWSRIELDEGFQGSGVLTANSDPGTVQSFDLGVNWWSSAHSVLRMHAIHTLYEQPVTYAGDELSDEQALLVSWQLHF